MFYCEVCETHTCKHTLSIAHKERRGLERQGVSTKKRICNKCLGKCDHDRIMEMQRREYKAILKEIERLEVAPKVESKSRKPHRKGIKASTDVAREYVYDVLDNASCVACGEDDPIVLEFDHIDRRDKSASVSAILLKGCTLDDVKEEIAKCQILCANCHRKKTAQENNSKRWKRFYKP